MNKNVKININKKKVRPKKSEVLELICDNSKIKKLTSWKESVSFEKGLENTIIWNKENIKDFKKNIYYV